MSWAAICFGAALLVGILAVCEITAHKRSASAGEAGTATTTKIGVVHEHTRPPKAGDAQTPSKDK